MEISQKLRKALGPEVAAFYSETKGLYIARIELPQTAAGDRRRREFTAKTPEALVQKARTLLNRYREAGDRATSSPTVKTWMAYWLDNIAAKRTRPKTLAGYRSVVNRQIIEAIGSIKLEKLNGSHVRRVHDFIREAGLSPTYALNAHRILSKAMEDAVREGKINRNPASLVDAPRKGRPQLQALNLAEAKLIIKRAFLALDAPVYDPEPARWATYLLTGQRRGEVIGLEWDRVDAIMDMSWQMQRMSEAAIANAPADFEHRQVEGGLYWTRPKSEAGKRMIPVVAALQLILEEHRKRTGPNQWGLVFTHNDRPIDPDWETKRWPKALAAMQVTEKVIRLHDLRHTAVDLLLEAGVPEDVVKELVGHSDVAMTRRYKDPTKLERRTQGMMQLSALLNRDL